MGASKNEACSSKSSSFSPSMKASTSSDPLYQSSSESVLSLSSATVLFWSIQYVWPWHVDTLAVSILMKYNTNINQTAWVANWGCELVSNPSYKWRLVIIMSWFYNLRDKNNEITQDAVAKHGAINKCEKAIKHDWLLTKTRYGGWEMKFKTRFLFANKFWTVERENQSSSCFSAMYKGYIY